MPLKAIKGLLDLEDEATRVSAGELKRRYGVPQEVLDRLAELEVITPNSRGYGASAQWSRAFGERHVLVAGAVSAAIAATLIVVPSARYGWIGEPFVWAYIGTLWLGGASAKAGDRACARHPARAFRRGPRSVDR